MYNSIYPAYVKSYLGVNNRRIIRKQDDEKSSQSSQSSESTSNEEKRQSNSNAYFPTGEKVSIDYTKSRINIDQVLTDFKNTANAIGAPDEIKTEVGTYLDLAAGQSQKNTPNQQIIQANLKNASQILDEYITNTLHKKSKVVENWVDALFMQKIDYKSSVQTTSSDIQTSPQQQADTSSAINTQQTSAFAKDGIYIPSDQHLKSMFIQAKKYAAINNPNKALTAFENTQEYADSIGDEETSAMIHYEKGVLYDSQNQLEDALYNYNNAAQQSSSNNIKAKAHIKMGKIYDDYVQLEPAFDHYCAAVSYAGEADNLKLQSQALSDIAQIQAEQYNKENALQFMTLADTAAQETNDEKVIGIISSKNGKNCEKLGENSQALKYYSNSAKAFYDIDDNANLAKRYSNAAEIMLNYGNKAKAKKLLSKAYIAAAASSDSALISDIAEKYVSV